MPKYDQDSDNGHPQQDEQPELDLDAFGALVHRSMIIVGTPEDEILDDRIG